MGRGERPLVKGGRLQAALQEAHSVQRLALAVASPGGKRAVGPCGLALGILMQWKLRPLLASCIMQKELAGLV